MESSSRTSIGFSAMFPGKGKRAPTMRRGVSGLLSGSACACARKQSRRGAGIKNKWREISHATPREGSVDVGKPRHDT
eukprot:5871914-Pleurochrysis_carterae.AAC.1